MKLDGWTEAFDLASARLVHESARRDRRRAHAHARFIGARLLFAALIAALLPAAALFGAPGAGAALVAGCALAAVLGPALLVARTGRLEAGQNLSSGLLSALIGAAALMDGGLRSHALLLLVIVMLDVALFGTKRSLWFGAAAAAAAVALAGLAPPARLWPELPAQAVGAALGAYALVMSWTMVNRNERHAHSQMRAQRRAAAALDAVGDAVLWREPGGRIAFANAGAHELVGLDRRDLDDDTLLRRVNVGDRPAFLKALADAQAGDARGRAVEIRMNVEHPEGPQARVFEMLARPSDAASAAPHPVVIVLRDVTERHAADALREAARRDAEKTASAKGQFLATMSHELRTPLNAIIGFSELLMQTELIPAGDPRRDEYARIINTSGQHLLEVVNAILDMSKIESGMMAVEQERIDAAAVARSSAELLGAKAAARQVAIRCAASQDLPEIVADRRALKQILLNLVSNAVKFSPAGSEVLVTCARDRAHVEIAVSDSGIGIAEEDLSRLGSPFFQVRQSYDREHEGTGLGLSVVRGLVGLLGGSMMIESAPGAGTRVAIRLPVGGAESACASEPVAIATRVRLARPALKPILGSAARDSDGAGPARLTA